MPYPSRKKGLEAMRNHPRIDPARKLGHRARVAEVGQGPCLFLEAGAAEHPAGEARAEADSGHTSQATYEPREPREFEENVGEFAAFEVRKDRVVLLLKSYCQLLLPSSATALLRSIRPGERIAILRTDNESDPIRVRCL